MKTEISTTPRSRRKPLQRPAAVSNKSIASDNATSTFSRLPMLQLGKHYRLADRISLELHFDLLHEQDDLRVQYRTANGAWRNRKVSSATKIDIEGVPERYHYHAKLPNLVPGESFEYIVLQDKQTVFQSTAKAPPAPHQPFSIALTGDIGDGGLGARQTAASIYKEDPDVVVLTGDVVYEHGRDSEYGPHFLSIYNADTCDPKLGAPLLRSRAIAAAVGNHDMGFPSGEKSLDLNRRPDLLGFFLVWSHPQNGPDLTRNQLIEFSGKQKKRNRLMAAIGDDFIKKVNYSFDVGNVHFIVLDANKYMDWTFTDLRQWLTDDLDAARDATWKIVVWHQPPFNSDAKYRNDERMCVISPILQKYGVDLVFHGHCHFYERTFPIRVQLDGEPKEASNPDGTVKGTIYLDKEFDGVDKCDPDGIIYVVTGAGGRPADEDHQAISQPFAAKVISERNSFTMLDVDGGKLTLRQMSVDNEVLDWIVISKEEANREHSESDEPVRQEPAA